MLAAGDDFPTFSRLADPLLEDQLARSAVWFAWLTAFWGLVPMMRALAIGGFLAALVLFAAVEWAARREGSRIPTLGEVCAFVMRYEVGPVPVGPDRSVRLLVVAGLALPGPLSRRPTRSVPSEWREPWAVSGHER